MANLSNRITAKSEGDLVYLASNPFTPAYILDELACYNSLPLVLRVASNPNLGNRSLLRLARHESPEVRLAVAENTATPIAELELLAEDDNPDIRYVLAENPRLSLALLEKLSQDENPFVRTRAEKTLLGLAGVKNTSALGTQENPGFESRLKECQKQEQEAISDEQSTGSFLSNGGMTELAEKNSDLLDMRDWTLQALDLLSDHLRNVSYKLRTPLAAVLGMNELLLSTDLNQDQRDLAKSLHEAGQSLLNIVYDLPDISRIASRSEPIESIPFNILYVIQDSSRNLASLAREKGLGFFTQTDQRIPEFVMGDPESLRQAIETLVRHSLNATTQGQVSVNAFVESEDDRQVTVRFTVNDNRPQLADSSLTRTSLSNPSHHNYGNLEIEFIVIKQLIARLGGHLSVQAKPSGGIKAAFDISFKLAVPNNAISIPYASSAKDFDSRKALVLVVEDNNILLGLTLKQLSNLGIKAHGVHTGDEAIESIENNSFDLILMDCYLPGFDGFEVTKAIRAMELESGKRTPIIAISAAAMSSDRENCLAADMDDFLSKPVTISMLKQKLEQWLPLENMAQLSTGPSENLC